MSGLNPALVQLAERKVWVDAGGKPMEKIAVVPPGGGAPPMDPMVAGGAPPPGMPPGGAPMPGAPPMDPMAAGGAPPMDPMAAGGAPADPMAAATGAAAGAAGQKMKPEQMMQMLDFRLYNMQQQLTAIMNTMGVDLPAGALITPPGSPIPVAEAAVPGGPQDPTQMAGGDAGGGGGGASAIGSIDPIQGASPELAMGGGGEKQGQSEDSDLSFSQLLEKIADGKADTRSTDGDVDSTEPNSSAPQKLQGAHPGKRPGTQAITAGGTSKDPKSQVDGEKHAAQTFGASLARQPQNIGFADVLSRNTPADSAAAVAAMMRRQAVT